jgi:small ligand-binding sensory domain FIST
MPDTSSPRFAAALSTIPDSARAADDVCQRALESLQGRPDLAVLFVSGDHVNAARQLAAQVCKRLETEALIGCSGESIVGEVQEIERRPAVSLWVARLPQVGIRMMHLLLERTSDGASIVGWHESLEQQWPDAATMLVLGDPFSFPADVMLQRLNEDRPGLQVVGGMASTASAPGENRLFFGSDALDQGAIAVILDGDVRVRTVVSQGCRPIGKHFVVTRSEGNVIYELGGKPALLQLKSIFDTLPTSEQQLVQTGLHVGRVVNEYQDQFEQGDFLVRNVMGIDPNDGSIAVGDFFRPGQTVQFHVRDQKSADSEMRSLLAQVRDDPLAKPGGGLLFTCNGRGTRLFPEPDHDASVIGETLGRIPVAGFFAAGELGPIGGKNFMHGFTASIALFDVP